MKKFSIQLIALFFISFIAISCNKTTENANDDVENEGSHPKLILTKQGVDNIRKNLGNVPIFDKTLADTKAEVDAEIELGILVPIPKDLSGGYTHERHKKNFIIIQKAGVLFQILNDEKYANYVKDMLFAYAKLYPTLPVHPQTRSYARGKLFWQCLNDSNWLVYSAQAYDCVYDWLSKEERETLEKDLFIPFAKFISEGNPQFFNRVHNHSTWGNVAVGMIALVMDNDELLDNALNGLKTDNLNTGMRDNDGGFIKVEGLRLGFFGNLDEPFSPDGYYNEGPYYQRYAMYPFLIFAEALHNVKPELKIFEYKDGVLLKAVDALLNLSDADGDFFPLNDGQKGMSYYTAALVSAVDIAYKFGGENPELLSIAKKQDRVVLDDTGLAIAIGIKEGLEKPFTKKSVNLSDGKKGDEGGVGILRSDNLELVYKYASHGSSHGHYDKLSFSLHEKGNEVLQDYGLARFVNIEQKGGGNYLKENQTWAKQTIAHNTITINEESHFEGKFEIGTKHHSDLYFYDDKNPNIQILSATEVNAYPGTEMLRTLALIKDEDFERPFTIDLFKIKSDSKKQYDLPYYYLGHIMKTNFEFETYDQLNPLGKKNGYQHLWKEASGKPATDNTVFSWKNNDLFYTLTTASNTNDELILARIGANDPEYNLRKEPSFIIRRKNTQNTTFASVIESHGSYSSVSELALNAYSSITNLKIVLDTEAYTAVEITTKKNTTKIFIISNKDNSTDKNHIIKIGNKEYNWKGSYYYK
ncbi:alginate lyase family protein [Polaribacter undariae]|uniref:Alginate lyase family protein n=1 Tax=Polaribacter sejongensis TaxID=985043 RepID=A0AAJ1VHY0_9FLAO|nr:alginate lyase family protein [Polaribacter undariae]MDN3621146.1 alginate lyase family protein [Polaribacter undariae]UWD33784.1 heparinase II/III family protein [Polaribacter undariae]